MFTGIVTDLGEVLDISGKGDVLFKIARPSSGQGGRSAHRLPTMASA